MKAKCKRGLLCMVCVALFLAAITGLSVNLSVNAEEQSSESEAVITVLTHGEIKSDSIFTQGGYHPNSLFEQICANGKTQRYRLQCDFVQHKAILYQLTPPESEGQSYLSQQIQNLELDIEKHSVILFKSFIGPSVSGQSKYLETMYQELKIALNDLLDKYCEVRGFYPKINLIGTSSGGLVNMKYATEYPDRVEQLISVGTPYSGSFLVTNEKISAKLKLENLINSGCRNQSEIKQAFNDISNKPKTTMIAIGMELEYFKQVLKVSELGDYVNYIQNLRTVHENYALMLLLAEEVTKSYFPTKAYMENFFIQTSDEKGKIFTDNGGVLMQSQWAEEISSTGTFLPTKAEGIEKLGIIFNIEDYNALASGKEATVQNLSPYYNALQSQKVTTAILSRIHLGVFEYSDVYSVQNTGEEIHITGVKKREISTLLVPETIAELPVTEISPYAFYDLPAVKHIQIEASVRYIAPENFSLCPNLESISLAESQNYEAENGVLYDKGKTRLIAYPAAKSEANFTVPDTVTSLAPYAFEGAAKLQSVDLSNVSIIGRYAFSGCAALQTVSGGSKVTRVFLGAFEGTEWLSGGVSLTLGKSAIKRAGAANLTNIEYIAAGALKGNTQIAFADLSKIKWIGAEAFYGCENLESVILGNNLETIETDAFGNAPKLKEAFFTSLIPPALSWDVFYGNAENFKITTAQTSLDAYRSVLGDKVTAKTFESVFNTQGGSEVSPVTLTYMGVIPAFPVPQKLGHVFTGWYDKAAGGTRCNEGGVWDKPFAAPLYAHYEKETYAIFYELNGGETQSPTSYTFGSVTPLLPAQKAGYAFAGWHQSANFSGEAVSEISAERTGALTLYAKFTPLSFTVAFAAEGEEVTLPEPTLVTFDEAGKLPKAERKFYSFDGWFLDEARTIRVTDREGAYQRWEIAENVTLHAGFKVNRVTFRIDGTNLYLSLDGEEVLLSEVPESFSVLDLNPYQAVGLFQKYLKDHPEKIRAGYAFTAFAREEPTAENLSEVVYTDEIRFDNLDGESVTLYQVWTEEVYSFDVYLETDLGFVMKEAEIRLSYNELLNASRFEKYLPYGYRFAGVPLTLGTVVSGQLTNSGISYAAFTDYTPNAMNFEPFTVRLILNLAPKEVTLEFRNPDGVFISESTVLFGACVSDLPAYSPDNGYAFLYWTLGEERINANFTITRETPYIFTAKTEAIRYTAYFRAPGADKTYAEYLDYSVENPLVLTDNVPTFFGRKFEGWTFVGVIVEVLGTDLLEDCILTASWKPVSVVKISDNQVLTLTDSEVVIGSLGNNFTLHIAESCNVVTFSFNEITEREGQIIIDKRSALFTLNVCNLVLMGPDNGEALMYKDYTGIQYAVINVKKYAVFISGRVTSNESNVWAIYYLGALTINGYLPQVYYSEFCAKGSSGVGNVGKDGINGAGGLFTLVLALNDIDFNVNSGNGTNGLHGKDGAPVHVWGPRYPGYPGLSGNDGEDGGNGGNAGTCLATLRLQGTNSHIYFRPGKGGNGGNGGHGSYGTNGNSGYDYDQVGMGLGISKVGTPGGEGGRGGNGGKGGNAGNAGNFCGLKQIDVPYTHYKAACGTAGNGGNGGDAGYGGPGGRNKDGSYCSWGYTGTIGKGGAGGTSGTNSDGTSGQAGVNGIDGKLVSRDR